MRRRKKKRKKEGRAMQMAKTSVRMIAMRRATSKRPMKFISPSLINVVYAISYSPFHLVSRV